MAETKDDIATERDALKAENDKLRAQLAASGTTARAYAPAQTFQLSEGDRQELVAHGRVNVGGVLLDREQVRAKLGEDQQGVDLGDSEPDVSPAPAGRRGAVAGVDFVYPSVAPGLIDPAVAGTPGISGPAADADAGNE
jgi:hypothetical protein